MHRKDKAMHITRNEINRATVAQMAQLFESFDGETEVWEGDDLDLLICDAAEIDEDDAETYRLIGTCAELAAQYLSAAAQRG